LGSVDQSNNYIKNNASRPLGVPPSSNLPNDSAPEVIEVPYESIIGAKLEPRGQNAATTTVVISLRQLPGILEETGIVPAMKDGAYLLMLSFKTPDFVSIKDDAPRVASAMARTAGIAMPETLEADLTQPERKRKISM